MVLTSFNYKFQHQLFKIQIQLLLQVWEIQKYILPKNETGE